MKDNYIEPAAEARKITSPLALALPLAAKIG
jgi:hypothetical protein